MARSSRYISESLRLEVAQRAEYRCEYCLRRESDSFFKFQVDHIISIKHGGLTQSDNLAYACPICNGNKGSDVGTILIDQDVFVRLFNPRKHLWTDHFDLAEGAFIPKSDIASATIKVLDLNAINRILERIDLFNAGLFP
jgi:hypothetical protein